MTWKPRMTDFTKVKDWARNYLPAENELRDAIQEEPDTLTRLEAAMKMDAYSRMLDSKARRLAGSE